MAGDKLQVNRRADRTAAGARRPRRRTASGSSWASTASPAPVRPQTVARCSPYWSATEADESYAGLRELGAVLNDREAGIAVHVIGLSNWHAVHTHCANCGEHTEVVEAGHVRQCPECGLSHFPRSDPAIIVLVTDDQDRALLGRNEAWPEGRYSTLAGFVEPGESLEAAVRREVLEETGVVVGPEVEYAGQPAVAAAVQPDARVLRQGGEHRHRGGRRRDRRGPAGSPGRTFVRWSKPARWPSPATSPSPAA